MDWRQPPRHEPPAVRRYGVALVAVVTSAAVATALTTVWGSRFPFLPFFPATMVAAWYGRFPAGAVASVLSIGAVLFLLPAGSFAVRDAGDVAGIGAFVIISLLISALCDGLHRFARAGAEAADRLHALLRDAPAGLGVLDRALRFVYVNDALVRINGVPRETHLGRTVGAVLAPEIAVRVAGFLREVLRTGEPIVNRVVAEGDAPRRSGPRVTLASYSPVRGPEGAVEHVAVAVMDITAQQELADALARSEARLQAIAQASIRITSTVSIDQPLDDTLRLIADLVRDITGAAGVQILTGAEEPCRQQTGGRSLAVPVMGRDGKRLGVLRLSHEAPAAFGVEDTAVAVQFAQMTSAAIESHRLHQRILEADRRKDEFLAMLGHELRNPLAAVQNAVATASRDQTRRDRAIEIARRQSKQLARLVDDLLDVARITQGRIPLQQEVVPLAVVARSAIEAARGQVEGRRHMLATPRIDETAIVLADPARLQQVFLNLLANAARYTDPGGRIEVVVERQGDDAIVRVRDSGHGIAPDMLSHVFDLFAQAERPLDRSQGGLGIGLTVARRLVELQGGGIEARSAGLGEGAEFIVRLPALPAPPAGAERSGRERATDPEGSARILVVEDNMDAAESLAMLLEVLGHEVRVVHDGESALAATRDVAFDVMLIDIGLPGMDGYELAGRLRARPEAARPTLVALTGYGRLEDRQRALAAGFDHHLVKPVEPAALEGIVAGLREASTRNPTLH